MKLPKITILYEDTHILAIDKPAGLVVHPDGNTEEVTLTDWIIKNYPKTKNVGEPILTTKGETIERPGIVHRLDRETSGVMLIAKTAKGHAHLKQQFQDRTVVKKYLAFLCGELKEDWGIINRPIGRSTGDFRKWSATRGARGELRPAETWWSLIQVVRADGGGVRDSDQAQTFSLVEAEPKTGRTHQIRVHFKAFNHPVVCDKLYAPERGCSLGFKRTALHAHTITFTVVPTAKTPDKKVKIIAPLPLDFKRAMQETGISLEKVAKNKGV